MKTNLHLFICLLLTQLTFGQQKSLLICTHLNTKSGKAVEKVSVVVDKVGTCITGNDGKCFYPTLKGIGMSVSIKASLSDYVPINNLELKSYRLSNQKLDTVKVIMSLIPEREKYALAYFEKETGIIIRKRFQEKEKSLYVQINGLVAKMNNIKDKTAIVYQTLEKNLGQAYKRLELVKKNKLNEECIAQRLATSISMLEGDEIPDYVSQSYSLFRQGNVEGADKALNGNAIDDQIIQVKLKKKLAKLLDESADRQLKTALAACLFKAQLKSSLYEFKEAEIWFEKAYQADTNNANTLFAYAYFLAQQNRLKRSAELYVRALQIYEALAKDSPEAYLPDVAMTLNNLGIYYKDNNLKEQAQKSYERALQIYESFAKAYPSKYLLHVAITLNNLGLFYKDNNLKEQAQKSYERALQIRESLAKDNPEVYLPYVATALNNLGLFYNDNNLKEQAQKCFERALQIRESLAKANPSKYLADLAMTLNNLGLFYKDNNLKDQAQKSYERALQIREALAKANPSKYLADLAMTLNNLGDFYSINNLKEQAQKSYEQALQIYESLSKNNSQAYLANLATTLNNLGLFYKDNNLKEQAQKCFERALQIRESLAKDNPAQYLPDLATTLNDLGLYYMDNNLKEQAQKYYERALQIRESLVKDNPSQYLADLATTLNNLGIFYSNNNLKEQAQKFFERALQIRESLAKDNPLKYLPDLASTQINNSLFWANEYVIEKAENLMVKALRNYQTVAILLNDDSFWQKAKGAKDLLSKLISIDFLYQHKLSLAQVILDFNSQNPLAANEEKASALGDASWYALFCKEYQLAEEYARKGLDIAPEQNWIYTNLALALLLQNRWDEAKQIYQEKQNLIENNEKPMKESFLNDLVELEKAGIKHPDFEKVRILLK